MKTAVRSGRAAALAFALCLPTAAWAAPPAEPGIDAGVRQELAEARREVRADLANARAELASGNLALGDGSGAGAVRRDADDAAPLAKPEITPAGDFLLDGEPLDIDDGQRRQLLAYRGLVLEIAHAGIDIGETTALAAIDAVDRGVWRMVVGAFTGSLERRVTRTVREAAAPAALRICGRMPALLDAQRQLAIELPAFRPYATLQARDVDNCQREIRSQLASL